MDEYNESLEVARLFREIMKLFKQNMDKLMVEMGMTAPQGMVMGILSKQNKMKISELSSKIHLSNSTVSGIVDRLEKIGLVERERSEEDKRVVYVSISPNFKDNHHNFHKRLEENTENIMSQGTPEELDKIFEGLTILKRLLSEDKNNVIK